MARVGIIGSGGWGTALALVLLQNGHEVILYGRKAEKVRQMRATRCNRDFLPEVNLPSALQLTNDLANAASGKDMLVLAVPSHAFRNTLREVARVTGRERLHIVSVAKGIENDTLMLMQEITQEELTDRRFDFVCLSGPSHAEEVARNIPTAIVAASTATQAAKRTQEIFMGKNFRVYSHTDIRGVELGGALKNVIALAAGIGDGVGFGDNTKAALITRGLVEMTRLGVAMGADPMTFAGLSGMGDLIVTCMSRHSRNRFVGEQIGRGKTLAQVLAEMVMVAEGVRTTKSAYALAERYGIEMPITEKVYRVLFENERPREAVAELMTREAKAEKWG